MPTTLTRCKRCKAPILFALTAAGRKIPLDPSPVDPATRSALALVGSTAMSRPDAVRRIGELYGVGDVEADRIAGDEYPWHVAHFATCTRPNMRDNPDEVAP